MPQSRFMVASGISAQASQAGSAGLPSIGLTAAGSTQATAFTIGNDINQFTTVAAGTGAILPAGNAGDEITVWNGGANALLVYPPVGGQVGAGAVNAGFSVAANKSCVFCYASASFIIPELSA
jgi:hypothetical protein